MSVNTLNACKAQAETINNKAVAKLSNNPNRSSMLGGDGMSPQELKAYFDGIGRYLAICLNNLIEYLEQKSGELEVNDWAGTDTMTINELVAQLADVSAATLLTAYPSSSSTTATPLQTIINGLRASITALESVALVSNSEGAQFDADYEPTVAGAVATKGYVDGVVQTEQTRIDAALSAQVTSLDTLMQQRDNNIRYTLPVATSSVLGGVKVDGSTINVDGNGVISIGAIDSSDLDIVLPTPIDIEISSSDWDNATSTAVINCTVANINALEMGLPLPTTPANATNVQNAMPVIIGATSTTITIKALGSIPADVITLSFMGVEV